MDTIVPLMFLLFFTGCLGQVCKFWDDVKFGGLFSNCRGHNLSSIPEGIPHDVVALDLSLNSFTQLVNNTFIKYPSLLYLNLDDNSISQMEPDTFNGLTNLTDLHLSWNKLSNSSFPEHVFRSLNNLQVLTLEMNAMTSYPDLAFYPLVNLRSLYIQSVTKPEFGPGFGYLKKLKFLQMDAQSVHDGHCTLEGLSDETFKVFRNISIETLIISGCSSLVSAETGVFEPLLALTNFVFSGNQLGVDKTLELLWPFVNRTMQRIDQRNILPKNIRSSAQANLKLTNESTKYLKDICVKKFIFSENNLIYMGEQILHTKFSACIEHLDLSDNNLKGDYFILFKLFWFPHLRYLNIRRIGTSHRDVSYTYMISENNSVEYEIGITLPANLQYMDVSGIAGSSASDHYNLTFLNGTNLRTLIARNNFNYLQYMARGITGLENLEKLDISENMLGVVNPQIFISFPNVRKLNVRACYMRFDEHAKLLFENLSHLEYLDISDNMLTHLPKLPNPSKLKELNLSINSYDYIPLTLNDFTNMTILDLSFNLITHITGIRRNELDKAYNTHKLQIMLHGNIFACGCHNLDLILWLVESDVVYETNRNFSCLLEDGTVMGTIDVARDYVKISRRCKGRYLLSYVVTFLTILLGSMTLVFFVAMNPARYRHMLLKICGFGSREFINTDFRYQMYVGYCETDIPFVFRNIRRALELRNDPIRLFLKDKDVLPGVDIVDGIVVGVAGSFKSLLVVSRDFLKDRWCQFTINVVVNSMTPLIPNRTILLILDDVELAEIPEPLLNAVDEDFILCVEDYDNKETALWQRIRELACV